MKTVDVEDFILHLRCRMARAGRTGRSKNTPAGDWKKSRAGAFFSRMQNAVAFANHDVVTVAWAHGQKLAPCTGFAVHRIDLVADPFPAG